MGKNKLDIFCLTDENGRLLEPAIQATVLAKYSRSPDSARDLLRLVTSESADKFQEKWVVKYGHNSVAELATVPVCFENVSIIASKFIESWQRAGYSEKSTRFQEFSSNNFITPPGCPETMKVFSQKMYGAYDNLMERMIDRCASLMDKNSSLRVVKARAYDNLRYLLPSGTGTNLAAILNIRDARDMVASMKGHPNAEFNQIGEQVQAAIEKICPVLLKHTEPNSYMILPKSVGKLSEKFDILNPSWYVDFHRIDPNEKPDDTTKRFQSLTKDLYQMDWDAFHILMEERPAYSEVPDVFKSIRVSFDIMMDYGAFRDLQRHRRCEQFVEPLGTNYRYLVPDDIAGSDLEPEYRKAMESVQDYGDESVIHHPDYYQYMVPLGYLHRSVFMMDLKELYYIAELRTKPNGHISYRRVAMEMFEIASKRYPELMKWCRVTPVDSIDVHN